MGKERYDEEYWVLDNPHDLNSCADHIEYHQHGYFRIDIRSTKEKREETRRAIQAASRAILREIQKQKGSKK